MVARALVRSLAMMALTAMAPCHAAVFTVGTVPGAGHATLASAWDAAVAMPGAHEIRLSAQSHPVGALLTLPPDRGPIMISGGWDDSFSTVAGTRDASAIVRLPGVPGPAIRFSASASIITLRNLTITNGNAASTAGGLDASLTGTARLELDQLAVRDNVSSSGAGAGAAIYAVGNAQVDVRASRFHNNTLSGDASAGAGLHLRLENGASATVVGSQFYGNTTNASGEGGALWIGALTSVQVQANDLEIFDNINTGADVSATGLLVFASNGAFVNLERLHVHHNVDNVGTLGSRAQVQLVGGNSAITFLTDSLIHDSPQAGLATFAYGGFTSTRLNNLTIARHGDWGLYADGDGILTMHNSIVHDNGGVQNFAGITPVNALGDDWMLDDPLFVNAGAGNFRLAAGSPGLDAGTSSVPGGLGQFDVSGQPRVIGPSVDIGAYESTVTVLPEVVFANDFEGTP